MKLIDLVDGSVKHWPGDAHCFAQDCDGYCFSYRRAPVARGNTWDGLTDSESFRGELCEDYATAYVTREQLEAHRLGKIAQEAGPVVERQPVAEVVMVDPFVLTTSNLHLLRKGDKLYTSPPAPVAVVLPDRRPIPDQATFNGGNAYYAKCFDEARSWNACLDKIKELNSLASEHHNNTSTGEQP